jgi:hypothetical protein
MLATPLRASSAHVSVIFSSLLSSVPSWREGPILTTFKCYRDGKLRLTRERGNRGAIDRFTLNALQVRHLLDTCRFSYQPNQVIRLPHDGSARVEAWVLPDLGLQLVRLDRFKNIVQTFRLTVAEWANFVEGCRYSSSALGTIDG